MTQYKTLNLKLFTFQLQLNQLKLGIKNGYEVIFKI